MVTFKIIAAFLIFLMTLLGGSWPLFQKSKRSAKACAKHSHQGEGAHREYPWAESMTSGIFLGAALLHMLPDAARDFARAGYEYPIPFLIMALSFLFFLLLEHVSVALSHTAKIVLSSIVLVTASMLSIHSFLEGAALGVTLNLSAMIIIGVAILVHKGAESFALSSRLNKSRLPLRVSLLVFAFFTLMTPLGIFLGTWATEASVVNPLWTPVFSALAAGTFLYIGTLHGLERSSLITHCCNMKEFTFMLAGFTLMAIIAVWA